MRYMNVCKSLFLASTRGSASICSCSSFFWSTLNLITKQSCIGLFANTRFPPNHIYVDILVCPCKPIIFVHARVYRQSDARICTKGPVVACSKVAFTCQGKEFLVSIRCMVLVRTFMCVFVSAYTCMHDMHNTIGVSVSTCLCLLVHLHVYSLDTLNISLHCCHPRPKGSRHLARPGGLELHTKITHPLSYSVVYAHSHVTYPRRHPPTSDESIFI